MNFENKYNDLRAICQRILDLERDREKNPELFDAALDELQEFLDHGTSASLEARKGI